MAWFLSIVCRLGVILLFVFGFVGIVRGQYVNGYQKDGYTYSAQYDAWHYPGYGYYKLSYYQQPYTYYYCGRAYTGYRQAPYYQSYTPPYTAPNYDNAVSFDSNAAKVFEIMKQQDKYVLEGMLLQAKTIGYGQLIEAAGIKRPFMQNYGLPGYQTSPIPGYSAPNLAQVGPYGSQGNTVYGYSVNTLAEFYNDNSIALGVQALGQANRGAQTTAGDVAAMIESAIAKRGEQQTRFAEAVAKWEGLAKVIKSAEQGGGRIETREQFLKTIPTIPQPPPNGNGDKKLFELAKQDCGACHWNGKKNGGFEINMLLNTEWKDKLKNYLNPPAGANRGCPQATDGTFTPLTGERLEFYLRLIERGPNGG